MRRRLARGKEDALRWTEKLGQPSASRPDGSVVWLHAVGLGEVLALRGLIAAMAGQRPDLHFLVTSTARSSAQVLAGNLPERTIHQFLPIDAPSFRRTFLDHWRPDLVIWAEQDLWPGFIVALGDRSTPQVWVNARLDAHGADLRHKAKSVYAALFSRFAGIWAQDQLTVDRLTALGARGHIPVTGSIKPAAPPLSFDHSALDQLSRAIGPRKVWLVGPSHAEDEVVSMTAHRILQKTDPTALLVIVPRVPSRAGELIGNLPGFDIALRSLGQMPGPETDILIADTFGEMGLWYRLASHALIGGSFGPVQGHNPWEAAHLGCAILHGPMTGNFTDDYAALDAVGGARLVEDADTLVQAILQPGDRMARIALELAIAAQNRVAGLARDVLKVLDV